MGLSRENSRQIGLLSRSGSREREELRKCERPSRLLGLILKTQSRATSTAVTQLKHSERFDGAKRLNRENELNTFGMIQPTVELTEEFFSQRETARAT